MTHAFIVTVHDDPGLYKRIIDRLSSDNHYFFVHVDKKAKLSDFKKLVPPSDSVFYIDDNLRQSVYWGGYKLTYAQILLIRMALNSGIKIDYLHNISGHDYPCCNNKVFDMFFCDNKGRSFMHFDSPEEVEKWRPTKYAYRTDRFHFTDWQVSKFIKDKFDYYINKLVRRKPLENVYAGWTWFSWHRDLAVWVIRYLDEHPSFLKRFHYTICSDEVLFHTLLYPFAKQLNIEKYRSLRFIEWYPKRVATTLPLVLDENEYEEIVNSGCLFCRKVYQEQSGKLLDMLDVHAGMY